MTDYKTYNKRLLVATLVLYCSIFLVNFLISRGTIFHYGKDGGLLFRVLSLCIFSSVFFLIIKRNIQKHFGIGFFIGLLSYLFVFFIYILSNVANGGDNSGLVLPVIGDQLVATSIVFIVGVFYWRYLNRKSAKDNLPGCG